MTDFFDLSKIIAPVITAGISAGMSSYITVKISIEAMRQNLSELERRVSHFEIVQDEQGRSISQIKASTSFIEGYLKGKSKNI